MLPFDLPPPVPIVQPAPTVLFAAPSLYLGGAGQVIELGSVAKESKPKPKVDIQEKAFEAAVSNFQQHLAKLPPKHKAEIRKLHGEVTQWADKARSSGQRADKLSTFVGKVMTYADQHLGNIEKADPKLLQFKAEHKQFQDLFLAGNQVIEAYLKWVRSDSK